ncbi:HepT-like ribonuclease domain-containing protein [Clostridium beijerinckii]|uniref:HepT-like ribonuclease domain-containing protein n=1 Tax=Clostridium beijerinckii TaxID=1520 RepID=UPI00232DF133|nr:HepT-like ribonuclease domain-containing protein [Clostridium beijerinckii]
MSPYFRYKKEKFLEKYKAAYDNLENLKEAINEYKKSNNKIIKRAVIAYFHDFAEYIIDMCESYIIINDGKISSSASALKLIEEASEIGFFDETLKKYLSVVVKLRNRYTHDYYIRETSENEIEKFCLEKLAYFELFLEESKDYVILKYRDKK